jgi:hypothetical protein
MVKQHHAAHHNHSKWMRSTLLLSSRKEQHSDGLIEKRWGTSINPPKLNDSKNLDDNQFKEHEEDQDKPQRTVPDIKDIVDANGKLLNQQPACNKILQSEVSLQLGESMTVGNQT